MKTLQNILKEITELTTTLETNYPELYRSLDENPLTIPTLEHPQMDIRVMDNYLESLKNLLESYLEEEKIKE
ncbi:hypothetical protein EGM88_15300 [Aureibaculum marinum]|uniref:Uncharacterized protein n=1 Tax=Aureibaculum marinum TaxID=2487930 RepID=A0A3N4N369_9FLAO|nr:hypothetical protein [Aureibaculum marinum]RPD90714.1 hypothetical protein EGM88_15300 [Aureibaculum marinum]